MALTAAITDVLVKDSGEKFRGQMHSISAKLALLEGAVVMHEQTFSEHHKSGYSLSATMENMRAKMADVKKRIEIEIALKIEAEKEVAGMLTKIEMGGK